MRHTFKIDGILVNPKLPQNFDFTPNDERDKDELEKWWDKPYILIDELQQESWIEHHQRLKTECDLSDEEIGTQEKWEKQLKNDKETWFKSWHTGFRYEVRCLDGGAWDRSTNYGMYATFEEAITVAKKLKGK